MANAAIARQDRPLTVAAALKQSIPALAMALPKHMDPERMARIALTTIRRKSDLQRCDVNSLAGAVLEAASLGLEIDSRGLAYLVPYKQEATLIVGYKGLMQLAYRSGKISNIYADVVFQKEVEADHVEITLGAERGIRHDFDILKSAVLRQEGADNPVVLAYAVAVFKEGHRHFEFVQGPEVEKRRWTNKAAEKGFLWNKWLEEAWKKTAIRKLCKYLDLSPEMQRAVVLDEQAESGEGHQVFDVADSINVDFSSPEPEPQTATDAVRGKVAAAAAAAAAAAEAGSQPEQAASIFCGRDQEPVFLDHCASSCAHRGGCPDYRNALGEDANG